MKSRILIILVLVLPMILLGSTWLERLTTGNANKLPFDGNRGWRLLNKTVSEDDGTGWEDSQRYTYHYNGSHAGQVDSLSIESHDPEMGQWSNAGYIHNTYLPGGEYLESSVMGFSFMGMTLEFLKISAVYDNQHRLTHLYMYSNPLMNREWIPDQRMHFVYSGTQFTVYSWSADMGDIAEYSKISFTRDAQGRMLTDNEQSSVDSLSWTDSHRNTYTWHPHDTSTGESYISYLAHNMPKMLMLMDDSGGLIPGMIAQIIGEEWNGSWSYSDKNVYTYNSDDTINDHTNSYYMVDGWEPSEKYSYSYDANHNVNIQYISNWEFGEWAQTMKTTYNWQQTTAAEDDYIPNPEILAMSVYPVPFRDALNISLAGKSNSPIEIEIFNLKGQLVHKALSSPNSVYSWNEVKPSGVYFIRASQDGHSLTRKAIRIK